MELTRSLLTEKAAEYRAVHPFAAVEDDHVEILPSSLADGEFGWRDVAWIVQWYFRRYLGAYPDAERRAAEDAFDENTYEAVQTALAAVTAANDTADRLDALTDLAGVDVPVASAFLHFMYPEEYVVVGDREWTALHAAGALADPYPDPPTADQYLAFQRAGDAVAERTDVDALLLSRALWQLGGQVDRPPRTGR